MPASLIGQFLLFQNLPEKCRVCAFHVDVGPHPMQAGVFRLVVHVYLTNCGNVLVLARRHVHSFEPSNTVGWIGVFDLNFVAVGGRKVGGKTATVLRIVAQTQRDIFAEVVSIKGLCEGDFGVGILGADGDHFW